jgi:hypothetical protein
MKKIFFLVFIVLVGAGCTKGFSDINGHVNPMISTWIWIGSAVIISVFLFKGKTKRMAKKAKVEDFKDMQ